MILKVAMDREITYSRWRYCRRRRRAARQQLRRQLSILRRRQWLSWRRRHWICQSGPWWQSVLWQHYCGINESRLGQCAVGSRGSHGRRPAMPAGWDVRIWVIWEVLIVSIRPFEWTVKWVFSLSNGTIILTCSCAFLWKGIIILNDL